MAIEKAALERGFGLGFGYSGIGGRGRLGGEAYYFSADDKRDS